MPKRRNAGLNVWTTWLASKGTYAVRWIDPQDLAKKVHQRVANTARKREANRFASEVERELLEAKDDDIRWSLVTSRYDAEVLSMQKKGSRNKWWTAINSFEELFEPFYLSDVDTSRVSQFAAKLREKDLAIDSIIGYLAELRRVANWAADIWPDYDAPTIKPPKGVKRKGMRGQAINREQFELMLGKIKKVVPEEHAPSWRRYLIGLYLSGLRLEESLRLTWDDPRTLRIYSLDARRPKLAIRGEFEKGNQDRLLPITPDFAAFLRKTPEDKRKGYVFSPTLSKGRVSKWTASKKVAAIGKKAGIIVDTKKDGQPKYASAHDLRRSFGTRLAKTIRKPITLQMYMRHESIQTTMKYYVGLGADDAADELWEAFGSQKRDLLRDPLQ